MQKERNDSKRKVYVTIGGMSYQLVSARDEDDIRRIAGKADEAVRAVRNANPSLSDTQTVILALVNVLDRHEISSEESAKARDEVITLREEYRKVAEERDFHRDAAFEIKKELLRIGELNRQLVMEIALREKQDETHIQLLSEEMPTDQSQQGLEESDQFFESPDFLNELEAGQDCEPEKENNLSQRTLDDYLDS